MIYEADNLSAIEKQVAIYLKDCMNNNTGRCFPSQENIAKATALSVSSVKRAIKGLKDKLYIEVVKESRNGKEHNTYFFILNQDQVSERTPSQVRETPDQVSERTPNLLLQPSIDKPSIRTLEETNEIKTKEDGILKWEDYKAMKSKTIGEGELNDFKFQQMME